MNNFLHTGGPTPVENYQMVLKRQKHDVALKTSKNAIIPLQYAKKSGYA